MVQSTDGETFTLFDSCRYNHLRDFQDSGFLTFNFVKGEYIF